jgi:hypothetical protein
MLPHGGFGGALGSWDAAVHVEEEMVLQIQKRVRKPSSTTAPVGVCVWGGGGGIAIIFIWKTTDLGRPTLMVAPVGVVAPGAS